MCNEIIDVEAAYDEIRGMRARIHYDPELGQPYLFEKLSEVMEWLARLAEMLIHVEQELAVLPRDPTRRCRPVRGPMSTDREQLDREDDVPRRRTVLCALKRAAEGHRKQLREAVEGLKFAINAIPRHLRDASYRPAKQSEERALVEIDPSLPPTIG